MVRIADPGGGAFNSGSTKAGGGVLKKASKPSSGVKNLGVSAFYTPSYKAASPLPPRTTAHASTHAPGSYSPAAAHPLNFSSSFSGGDGGGGGAAAPAPVDPDAWKQDPQYLLQLAALQKAAADEQDDITNQTGQYNNQYNDALAQLGWSAPADPNAVIDPKDPNLGGTWDFGDQNTASGRSFQNQQNDFAGRGLLQSSAYATANDDLTRSLDDQLSSTNTAKQSFLDNLAQQQKSFLSDNQNQIQQAKIDALARMASGVTPTAV